MGTGRIYENPLMSNSYHHWLVLCWLPFCLISLSCSDQQSSLVDEVSQENEAEQAQTAVKNFRKLLDNYKTSYVTRGAHAKAHACLHAYFDVNNNIETRLQHGIFARPGRQYQAWIRFSNGHFDLSVSQDQKSDARGMAVKILEPPGQPMQIAANNVPTQDFLMTNSPVFFIENISDYNALVAKPDDLLRFIFDGLNPFNWRIKVLFMAKETLTPPPDSLLTEQYYSITAYKLGPYNIKFSTRPCQVRKMNMEIDKTDPDFLGKRLARELVLGEACFDFMVQLQVPDKNMSIEDPTIEWKESDSPFIPMARITIPPQGFDTPELNTFCENLSFAPWHALPDHRPIGQFNRMRRAVYPASSDYRHTHNNTSIPQDLSW
jgi:catalase